MISAGKAIADSPATPTLLERLHAKVIVDQETGCHLWQGALSLKRRGRRPVIRLGTKGSRVVLVARLVLELKDGPPPTPHHEAGHTCPAGENSICVNPDHLRWMTRLENEHSKRARARDCQPAASHS